METFSFTSGVSVVDTIHMENPIRAYRNNQGLTQSQLAELVGVKKAAVSKWEVGNGPSAAAAIRLEQVSDGAVPRWLVRPDLWERPQTTEAA